MSERYTVMNPDGYAVRAWMTTEEKARRWYDRDFGGADYTLVGPTGQTLVRP